MFNAGDILQTITLAICGWTLLEVINIGKVVARHEQKLRDLRCQQVGTCENK